MTDSKKSEREVWWVLGAQSGSQEALNELFKAVQEPLFRYILTLVKKPQLAEDILQEVFMRIYRKLRWLHEPRAFRAWAYQIATRETFRHLKRERPWESLVKDDTALAAIPFVARVDEFPRELLERLPQLVDNLPPASRAVVALYYLHEMSLPETAAVLRIPLGTVKSRLAYGLGSLRQQLQEQRSDA